MGLVAIGQTTTTLVFIVTAVTGAGEISGCLSESLVSAVLQDNSVQVYLHPELPGRNPLRVAAPGLSNGTRLQVGQAGGVVVEGTPAEAPEVFRFTRCARTDGSVIIEFQFRAEGLRGSMSLKPANNAWQVQSRQLVEQ